LNLNVTPVLHRLEELHFVLSDPRFKTIPLVLKVNTGMNRLGIELDELEKIAPRLKARGIKHLMSHFAYSYVKIKDGDKTHRQLIEFQKAKNILASAGVTVEETSIANSGAIEQGLGFQESHIRPGLMLYGPPSLESRVWKGHQISRLVTKVLKTFLVKKGTPVGYGINVVNEDALMVLIPLGYGDGLMTFATGATIYINGLEGKIFGRINMDMSFLIFPADSESSIKVGDEVEIWSHDNCRIADLSAQIKTIPYQLMCGITHRIPKIYRVK
jgi:alanine racemase